MSAVVAFAIERLAATWRIEVEGQEHLTGLRAAGMPFAFALWHNELVPLLWHHRGYPTNIMVSQHRDARHLVYAARRWGFNTIEGSSTRGGAAALRTAVRVLEDRGEIAITPDGPTGPRHVAKRGVVEASRQSGAPILPVWASTDRCWKLGTWDRLEIPKPWARVRIGYGAPIHPGPDDESEVVIETLHRALGSVDA